MGIRFLDENPAPTSDGGIRFIDETPEQGVQRGRPTMVNDPRILTGNEPAPTNEIGRAHV